MEKGGFKDIKLILIFFFFFFFFRIIHSNGEIYDGDLNMGEAHGYGVYIHADQTKYEGE